MPVQDIYLEWPLVTGGSDAHSASARYTNPWATEEQPDSPVVLLCTTKYVAGDGQSDFGIYQIEYLDDNGQAQVQTFGDPNTYGSMMDSWPVSRFIAVTVLANTFDAAISGSVTMFLMG